MIKIQVTIIRFNYHNSLDQFVAMQYKIIVIRR